MIYIIWSILYDLYYMIYIIWSILYDLYYMIYIIWSILYDLYMIYIWSISFMDILWSSYASQNCPQPVASAKFLKGPPLGGSTPAPGDGGSASTSRESSSRTQLSIDHSPAVDCFISSSIHHLYPLVNIQKAIEHGPVEIVDFPMVIFHSYVGLAGRVL